MIGFLLKVIIIAVIIGGGYLYLNSINSPLLRPQELANQVKTAATQVDMSTVGKNLSTSLDNLVTHPDKNSPMVLGIKITNDSLQTIVNVLQNLPPDQINQIKSAICSPATPSSR